MLKLFYMLHDWLVPSLLGSRRKVAIGLCALGLAAKVIGQQ